MAYITSLEFVLHSVNFTVLELFPVCHRHPIVFITYLNIEFLIQFNINFFLFDNFTFFRYSVKLPKVSLYLPYVLRTLWSVPRTH